MKEIIVQMLEIIIGWAPIIIIILVTIYNKKRKNNPNVPNLYGSFNKKEKIMTNTELQFYNLLKKITSKYELELFTQVALNQIIKADSKRGNLQIGAKSIDFVITDKYGNIKICIELDDYTHQRKDRIKRDNLVNELFRKVKIKLLRIPIEQAFIVERIEKTIKESL